MMEEQYSRRIRSNNSDSDSVVVVDRISALPDCILGVILSFLFTKEAVGTSLLSKRWKSAWLDVHNLHLFSYHDSDDDQHILSFIRFVHRALRLTDGRPLYIFTLVWFPLISSHIICWIDAAITRNVREIDLYLGPRGDILTLPITGFNCDSLRSLQIDNIFFVYDTSMVCLPRLETLELGGARFTSKEAFEKLINGCPMLHYLKVYVYRIPNEDSDDDHSDDDAEEEDFMYIVSSPSLRHLDMHIQDRCRLKLNAPSLEYLKLNGRFFKIFVEKSLSSLVEADFAIEVYEPDLPHNLIVETTCALEHAKFLTLSACVLQAFSCATFNLSTEFKRLVKLVAGNYCCSVQDFIHNSENLEELIILQDYWFKSLIDPHDHSRWRAPVKVPRCLSNSLKRVRLDGYKGLQDEREMIRYMLEHGSALEVMQICYDSMECGEKLKLIQEIRVIPRKSRVCKVQFSRF